MTVQSNLGVYLFLLDDIAVEKPMAVLAHTFDEANNQVRGGLSVGVRAKWCGRIEVEELLNKVNIETKPAAPIEAVPPDVDRSSVRSFISGLKLMKDRYVKDARDLNSLTRIINNLEKSYG